MNFRKLKLRFYKKKKVREQKTFFNNEYVVYFKVKVKDQNNPHTFDKTFNMVVPAKAAFFAKRKVKQAMLKKIEIECLDVDKLTEDEVRDFYRERENSKTI